MIDSTIVRAHPCAVGAQKLTANKPSHWDIAGGSVQNPYHLVWVGQPFVLCFEGRAGGRHWSGYAAQEYDGEVVAKETGPVILPHQCVMGEKAEKFIVTNNEDYLEIEAVGREIGLIVDK